MDTNEIALIYIGAGAALHDVPARDLTQAEADRCGGVDYLVSTGLYQLNVSVETTDPRSMAGETDRIVMGRKNAARKED